MIWIPHKNHSISQHVTNNGVAIEEQYIEFIVDDNNGLIKDNIQ